MKQRESPLPVSNASQKRRIKQVLIDCILKQTKGGSEEKQENAEAIANALINTALKGVESYMGITGGKIIGRNRSWAELYVPSGKYRVIRINHAKRGGVICIPVELAWDHPKLDARTLPEAIKLAGELIRAWPMLPHGQEILHFSIQKGQTQPIQKQ